MLKRKAFRPGQDHGPRQEGFLGQRIVRLPPDVVKSATANPLTRYLIPEAAGYYPHAAGHFVERPEPFNVDVLIFCSKGHGWCEMAGQRHQIGPGQLLVMPRGLAHGYGADPGDPWSIRWLHVTGEQARAFRELLKTTVSSPVIILGEDLLLNQLFENMLSEMELGYSLSNMIYFCQALAHLYGTIVRKRLTGTTSKPDSHQRISRCIEMMQQHLDSPVPIAELAAAVNLCPAYFSTLFKEHAGYAPKAYFVRLKMHKASQLLLTTTFNIKKIANTVGYDDQLHFSRAFKRINGSSPSEYRLSAKG